MPDLTIPEILECAADYLRSIGWRGDAEGQDLGPTCAVGAISQSAQALGVVWLDAADAVEAYLGLPDSYVLHDWNDAPGRTASEVINALMECAAALRCKELP